METIATRAVIIGGGIAGLYTAKVLSEFYREVLLIDKDKFPNNPAHRKGTPQAFHPHRFTQRGKVITDRLFPGFEKDLLAQGGLSSLHRKMHHMNPYGSMEAKFPRDDVKFSRAVLEWVIREHVKTLSNVRLLPETDGVGLLTNDDQTRVTGVSVRRRDGRGEGEPIAADLVVDTSGRSSKLAAWLKDGGYDVPKPDLLKVNLGYSTRRYRVPDDQVALIKEWDTINISGHVMPNCFTGVLSFIENQVVEVALYKPGGVYPPTDIKGYEEALSQLPSPLIASILQNLEPLTPPRAYRVPYLHRYQFSKMERWPKGLLVLGDAYCIFDPIFGQGMTVAAMEAEVLASCLREQQLHPHPQFEQQVLQKFEGVIEPAWWLNCAADLRCEGVEYIASEPLHGIQFGQQYMDLFLKELTIKQDFKHYGLYWGVNTLSLSPHAIFNSQMITATLHASAEGMKLLEEFSNPKEEASEQHWEQLVPTFSQAYYEPLSNINK
ncbi:FAD-dependent oxidoreductase [Marininema halotolerans]|uniref:Dehydrogenase (Flavoprotein) n=1 Tax=Marininema halotolerans TaxID=1155944 RepID=A0A1I6THW1_9BACL|nr:FAD dependent oxidoreductase [Marininema halotolerans]SFS88760.1 Dehydrogenase (flavoprotein) [Marininema halotolerans]